MSRPDVQLIIALHTRESIGVASEIAHFVSIPEIKAKTAILFPTEFYLTQREFTCQYS